MNVKVHNYVKIMTKLALYAFVICQSLVMTFAGELDAQRKYLHEIEIDLPQYQNAELKDLISDVQDRSNFEFASPRKLINGQTISINEGRWNMENLLKEISTQAKISIRRVNETISFSEIETQALPDVVEVYIEQVSVSGKITDEDGEPLPGATIQEKGTTNGTITDIEGNYTLSVPENATLSISFVGFQTQQINLNGQTVLNVSLKADISSLEEVVVVGYGTQTKEDLTGSISQVTQKSVEDRSNISISEALQGAVPGLNVGETNTVGGQPSVTIRGRTSISGTQSPLIVLDGIIFRGSLIDINPNDIASIDVLKDASATAIYGSQASNGVIIISTKSGKVSKKPTISYSGTYSFQEPTKSFEAESPEEFLERVEAAYFFDSRTEESGYLEPNNTWEITSVFATPEQVNAYQNNTPTDWYGILTNDRMYTQSHNLSMSQRADNSGYFVSLGYTGQQGFMVNDDYERLSARINLDNEITDWLKVGVQSFLTTSDYTGVSVSPAQIYNHSPYAPAYDDEGELIISPNSTTINPLYTLQSDNLDKRLNLFGNIYAEIDFPFLKGLSFRTNYSANYITDSYFIFQAHDNNFLGRGAKNERRRTDWVNDNILTYKKLIGDVHEINAMVGYGRIKREFTSTQATATDFNSPALGYNNLQAGNAELQTAASDAWQETALYTMGRLHYNYDSKYFLTGTFRRDGFSGFSEKNKFGIFPSVAIGWNIAKENFWSDSPLRTFEQFKIRASYGSNGNRTIGRYQTLAKIGEGFRYVDENGVSVYAKDIATLASPNLKWETTTGINIGIDYSLLESRLSGTIDYYNNNTTDLLYNVDIPGISRFQTFPDNLGKMHNSGIELSISSLNINTTNFSWRTQFNYSRVRNDLRELLGFDNDGDGQEDDLISEGLFIGESLGTIFDYHTNGDLWQFGDEIPSTAGVGSYKIEDVNGDGVIDPDDRKIIGHSEPAYRFSINNELTYKNWQLSIFVNSVQGNNNYYLGADVFDQIYPNSTAWDRDLFPKDVDFWLPENPDARYERLGVEIAGGIKADRYMPRSFVRIQNINLAYSFDSEFLERLKIQKLRIFIRGRNLLTFTKWPGWDPETGEGITRFGRPVTRNYTVGLNVDL